MATLNELKAYTVATMAEICKVHGTPQHFLEKEMKDMTVRAEFAEWLWPSFQEKDDALCCHSPEISSVPEAEMSTELAQTVHVLALGFDSGCSVKGPPGREVAMQLCEHIMMDGFVTNGEPLLITQPQELLKVGPPAPWAGGLTTMSLGYVKGQARVTTLLSILFLYFKKNFDVSKEHPVLAETVQKIFALKVQYSTKIEEGLANMKYSARGSVRKANNVITTVLMLQKLSQHGLTDPALFVRRWNQMSTMTHQITGRRAVTLKLLLDCAPPDTLTSIMGHVRTMGWSNCCWSDDNLASKKIYPRHQFPSKSKQWLPRLKTTSKSMMLMVQRAQNLNEQASPDNRKKLTSAQVESMAERAAVCLALAAELQTKVPIPDVKILEAWVAPWSEGSDHINTEIETALIDKSDMFDVAVHVPALKALVDARVFSNPVANPTTAQATIDIDLYELTIKQIRYDMQAFEVWERKCSTAHAAHYHKQQEPHLLLILLLPLLLLLLHFPLFLDNSSSLPLLLLLLLPLRM
ncbi:unnamed protein product [Prorocentrum cordatum]|uniref:Uncharacterized protein n=1 Tax=Prorocentrum cordatum TaxID=2364126 RepID=A0ABN9S2U3_9DINO|nr:unnamed protein product [Polarella glacialis]